MLFHNKEIIFTSAETDCMYVVNAGAVSNSGSYAAQ